MDKLCHCIPSRDLPGGMTLFREGLLSMHESGTSGQARG